ERSRPAQGGEEEASEDRPGKAPGQAQQEVRGHPARQPQPQPLTHPRTRRPPGASFPRPGGQPFTTLVLVSLTIVGFPKTEHLPVIGMTNYRGVADSMSKPLVLGLLWLGQACLAAEPPLFNAEGYRQAHYRSPTLQA